MLKALLKLCTSGTWRLYLQMYFFTRMKINRHGKFLVTVCVERRGTFYTEQTFCVELGNDDTVFTFYCLQQACWMHSAVCSPAERRLFDPVSFHPCDCVVYNCVENTSVFQVVRTAITETNALRLALHQANVGDVIRTRGCARRATPTPTWHHHHAPVGHVSDTAFMHR